MRQTETNQRQPRDSQPQPPLYRITVSHYRAGELTSEDVATHSREPYQTLRTLQEELRLGKYRIQVGSDPMVVTAKKQIDGLIYRVTYRATRVEDETAVEPVAKAQAKLETYTASLSERQKRQIAMLRHWEPAESLTNQPVIQVMCHTCKESKEFRSVDGARSFVLNHAGHYTWIDRLRNERPSLPPLR